MIIMLQFSPVLLKSIGCGCSLEAPREGASNELTTYVFIEKQEKLSQNYHQILLLNNSSGKQTMMDSKQA